MLYQYVMTILWSGWSMFDVRCSAYLSGNCDRNTDHDINCCDYWVVHDNLTAESRAQLRSNAYNATLLKCTYHVEAVFHGSGRQWDHHLTVRGGITW